MNATEINGRFFKDNSKYIGEVVNDCEIIGYRKDTKQFLMQCTFCGNLIVRNRATVTLGKSKCECQYKRMIRHTDGFAGAKLKSIYMNMLDRCCNKNNHAFSEYGGRGIGVCDEWKSDFRSFLEWSVKNGYKEGLTLDRIDNDCIYSPENCRWCNRKEQANNRRSNVIVCVDGVRYTISQLAEKLGVPYQTLYSQIKRGQKYNECG